MARYGRDLGRERWSGYGQGGFGGGMNRYGGDYLGTGPEGGYGGGQGYSGRFGPGGGAYDNDFGPGGYGGQGYGGGQGPDRGYGADTGFSGGGYGGAEGEWRGRGGYGQGYGGGAGYTAGGYGGQGGYGTGGLSRGRDMDPSFGGSSRGGNTGGDELRRMRAADVMTDNPETVTPETTLADAARKMRDLDVGIIPVVESDTNRRLRGVLTDRDIAIRAVAEGRDTNSTRVMEVMTTQIETCNKNDSLRDVLSVMEREQVRRVPITDREGRLVGIIAQADVATEVDSPMGQRRFANTLEQISEPGSPRERGSWNAGGRGGQTRGTQSGGGMSASRGTTGTTGGGMDASRRGRTTNEEGAQGNTDPRAFADPGSENV
jgi:CBS domain-containing protein